MNSNTRIDTVISFGHPGDRTYLKHTTPSSVLSQIDSWRKSQEEAAIAGQPTSGEFMFIHSDEGLDNGPINGNIIAPHRITQMFTVERPLG